MNTVSLVYRMIHFPASWNNRLILYSLQMEKIPKEKFSMWRLVTFWVNLPITWMAKELVLFLSSKFSLQNKVRRWRSLWVNKVLLAEEEDFTSIYAKVFIFLMLNTLEITPPGLSLPLSPSIFLFNLIKIQSQHIYFWMVSM